MSRNNNLRFRWICPDGTTVCVSASVMKTSARFREKAAQSQFDQPIHVPIPGWIVHRLVIWMQRFTTFYTMTNKLPETRDLVLSDLKLFDYDLGHGTLFDLFVLFVAGLYLQIPRLIFVVDTLTGNRMYGLTQQQTLKFFRNFSERQLRDFEYLVDRFENDM